MEQITLTRTPEVKKALYAMSYGEPLPMARIIRKVRPDCFTADVVIVSDDGTFQAFQWASPVLDLSNDTWHPDGHLGKNRYTWYNGMAVRPSKSNYEGGAAFG